jgi:hypothetical protein
MEIAKKEIRFPSVLGNSYMNVNNTEMKEYNFDYHPEFKNLIYERNLNLVGNLSIQKPIKKSSIILNVTAVKEKDGTISHSATLVGCLGPNVVIWLMFGRITSRSLGT